MWMSEQITIEVVYATPERQKLLSIEVSIGTTAIEAVRQSGILTHFVDLDMSNMVLGVFGKLVSHDTILRHQDRVEIYRSLKSDPKTSRRQRASRR